MKVKSIKKNLTEICLDNVAVLFSYETPVCAYVNGEFYRTNKFYSTTTSKHINQWLGSRIAIERPQMFFDNLVR